jgi:acid phosphatase
MLLRSKALPISAFIAYFCLIAAGAAAAEPTAPAAESAEASLATGPGGQQIKHVFVVVFENTNAADSRKQEFMKSLIAKGGDLSNFHAISHPSQPNYVAMIAGDPLGVSSDGLYDLDGRHLGDLLEAKGKGWKIYSEDYPQGQCFTGSGRDTYVRKHNPFISFADVRDNEARCKARVASSTQLDADIEAGQLPEYAMYVPGLDNDGHDTNVTFADRWLERAFGPRLANPKFMDGTLFAVTFDENDMWNDEGQNLIYTVLVGAGVKPGSTSTARYDHYSLLRMVEDIFALGTLGRKDQAAAQIKDIWQAAP